MIKDKDGQRVYWWDADNDGDEDDCEKLRARALLEETALVEQNQHAWHELALWNATLFTNREQTGFRWGDPDVTSSLWPTNLRTENIIAAIGEAFLSKASSSPLKPTPVPHGGSYKTERAVRLLDQFLIGVWRQVKAEDAAVQMFRDAYWAGVGCVRVAYDSKAKSIHVERVFPDCLVIDDRECANGDNPKTYRIRQVVPRASIEARYGVELGPQGKYHDTRGVAEGWVVVVEAWRMPDSDGSGGRHTIVCCDKVLDDEPWKHDWVPLVFFHWGDRTSSFFVQSGVEQVVPFQCLLDDLNDDIREAQDIACRPRMKVNANSMIDVSQWDNRAGRFLMWSGSEPEPLEWNTNLNELYQERERTVAKAFSRMGLSEMFTNADLPPGTRMDSSAAVREVRNMEDGRHLRLWTLFEAARLSIARAILNVLSTAEGAKAFSSQYHPGAARASAKNIPYEAVCTLTEDDFSWTLEATPLSQMSPAARRELLRDWTSRGLIEEGSDEARRMEGNPNLERIEDLELASADDILRHLDLLEDGKYEAPTPMTNCTLGIKKVTANYHRLKSYEDVPVSVLQNHIKWVTAATAIQQKAVALAQGGQMVPFAPAQGVSGTNATTAPPPPQ